MGRGWPVDTGNRATSLLLSLIGIWKGLATQVHLWVPVSAANSILGLLEHHCLQKAIYHQTLLQHLELQRITTQAPLKR